MENTITRSFNRERWKEKKKQIQLCKEAILEMLKYEDKTFAEILFYLEGFKASAIYLAFGQLEDDGIIIKDDNIPPIYHIVFK